MTPVTTTRAEAAKIIRAAYDAKTLPAQNGLTGTYYEATTGSRCAIGQLFPVEDARELQTANGDDYMMAGELIANGLLVVDDHQWFVEVQQLHDEWASSAKYRLEDTPDRETMFLELLA